MVRKEQNKTSRCYFRSFHPLIIDYAQKESHEEHFFNPTTLHFERKKQSKEYKTMQCLMWRRRRRRETGWVRVKAFWLAAFLLHPCPPPHFTVIPAHFQMNFPPPHFTVILPPSHFQVNCPPPHFTVILPPPSHFQGKFPPPNFTVIPPPSAE